MNNTEDVWGLHIDFIVSCSSTTQNKNAFQKKLAGLSARFGSQSTIYNMFVGENQLLAQKKPKLTPFSEGMKLATQISALLNVLRIIVKIIFKQNVAIAFVFS